MFTTRDFPTLGAPGSTQGTRRKRVRRIPSSNDEETPCAAPPCRGTFSNESGTTCYLAAGLQASSD